MIGRQIEIRAAGRKVAISSLNKVLYPEANFTKADVLDYYIRISPVLLPHLKDRPLSLKRYPDGVDADFFYEKRCPPSRPHWVKTIPIWSKGKQRDIEFCTINDLPSLVWAANLANLELHTFLAKRQNLQCPTMLVFDLDPGSPADIRQCAQVGLWLREALERLDLQSYAKTSGSKGLQVYIPLNTPTTYEQTKSFARAMAEFLEREHGDLVLSRMTRSLRAGKVFIDWSQNDQHKTTVCVYSLRGKAQPTVSTPVTWEEVRRARTKSSADCLTFTYKDVLRRARKHDDLFKDVLKRKQKLPSLSR